MHGRLRIEALEAPALAALAFTASVAGGCAASRSGPALPASLQLPQLPLKQPGSLMGQSADVRHATQMPASELQNSPTGAHALAVVRQPNPQSPESGLQNETPGAHSPLFLRQSG